MGRPMALNLMKAGHTLWLHRRSGVSDALNAAGGMACTSGKEAAQNADVIILIVPDTPLVQEALFGKYGIGEGLSPGKTVVDMSSISPLATKQFAKSVNELGCEYLDAPVSGGEV